MMLQVSSSSSSSLLFQISNNAPTSKPTPAASKSFVVFAKKVCGGQTMKLQDGAPNIIHRSSLLRRVLSAAAVGIVVNSLPVGQALAEENQEYVKETTAMISKVKTTIGLDKSDPNVATAVAELREASNAWVAKYRREKALLGRASFRDMYSALNAVSGHYISFGPTAPIPVKRRTRILEEVDTAEKALLRGR